ncbi:MAG: IPTL-CTERM sorting domain-containing protein [Rhodocyclaceae bacterium]|nr:IPTL-CTERM sorting domain-containing protein [Rhodocyclaceae bacterium]
MKSRQLIAALALVASTPFAPADTFPPDWGLGTVDEAAGPIHFAPVAWPTEPSDAADCGHQCGDWMPYTRFQGQISDPRVQDPSNGGTSPQNYVNVASSCIDRSLPSIYYHLYKDPTDPTRDVLMFRWRVEQVAHTYATGPSAGSYRSSDPWNSALWTVMFDIDGDGYRDLAAHLDGSSGNPAAPIDMIAGIWGNIPTQSIDYLNDPSIKLIAHNPTAFTSGNLILNFHDSVAPDTTWPAGATATSWDYGSSRARLVSTNACTEYFIDYQIPVRMLDASATGPNPALDGPKITRDTPISMLFCTANSLNDPLQKDCSLERAYEGDAAKPGPFGDYLSFNNTAPYSQPIVAAVEATAPATCPGSYELSATVQDTLYVDASGEIAPSVSSVRFLYWADSDGDGTMAGDTGSRWTDAATATLAAGSLNRWQASWDATSLPKGKYLIGVQAIDDPTLHDDGVPDAPVSNRTFSYLSGSTASATQAQIYINPWTYDGESRTWISGGSGDWIAGQQAAFPDHDTPTTPDSSENWYGNPDVTGVQTALIGVAINACGVAPTLTKEATPTSATVGQDITFTLTVANPATNPGAVTLTSIADPLPAGFTYTPGTTTGAFGSADPSIGGNVLTWSGNVVIAPGGSASLGFTAQAPTVTGTYTNTASAVTDFGALTGDPVQIGVGEARLSLSKTASDLSLGQGDALTWTLSYSNDSPIDAQNVVLTDILPDGVATASCSGGCTCTDNDSSGTCNAGDTLSWSVGTLAAGAGPYSVTVSTTVANPYPASATVPLTNTATLDSDDTAAVQASAASYVSVPRPQLTLAKTADKTIVDGTAAAPANQVTFTLTYRNDGAGDALGAVLADALPDGFEYLSASPSPDSAPAVGSNGSVSWNLGTVAAGASGSTTVTLRPSDPFTGAANPATNTATLSATGQVDVQDSAAIGVLQSGQVCSAYYFRDQSGDVGFDGSQLLGTSGIAPTGADIGDSTTITVPGGAGVYSPTVLSFYQDPATISNTEFAGNLTTFMYMDRGPGPGITIRTTVYDYDSDTGARVQLGQGTEGFTGGASGLLTFSIPLSGTLQKNHRLLWTYEAASNNAQSTDLQFQYDGTVSNAISGSGAIVADSRAEFCVTPPANLVVDKHVDTASIDATGSGRTLTYGIDFANTSSATDATNATIVDTLPAGTSFSSATLGGLPIVPTGTNPYTFDLGTVSANSSGTLEITVDVDDDLGGLSVLANLASIASDQTAEQTASAATSVVGSGDGNPRLVIAKSVDDTSLVAGQTATYTLTVLNAGDGAAAAVTVSDVLPVSADFAYSGCATASGSCSESGGTLTWNLGSLAIGASATATVTMQVAASPASGITTLDNQASVSDNDYCSGGTPPPSCTSGPVTVSISTNPDLSIAKSVDETAPSAGDTLTYTLVVSNDGSSAAENVVVRDPILGYMSFAGGITASAGSGSFDAVGNRVVFDVGTLASGASATLSFQASIVGVMPSGDTTLTNNASANASNSPLRTASAASTVAAGPVLEIVKAGPPSLPLPAARLSSAAAAATTLFVDDASRLATGDILRIDGTLTRIQGIAGNSLAVDTPVTAGAGTDVLLGGTWSLSYRNTGDADATGVVVTDTLPAGWRYVGSTPVATTAPAVDANGSVSWTIGSLAAGASGSVRVEAVPTTVGSHVNSATIEDADYCTGATPPPTCASDRVTTVGGLTADKFTTTPLTAAGGTVAWTVVVHNSTASPVGPVTVVDELPPGFTVAAGTTTVDGNPAADPVLLGGDAGRPQWTISVPAGGSTTIGFSADVDALAGPATYQNGVVLDASGVGIVPFDALRTTAEDVTVLAAGTGLVEGVVYRDLDGDGEFDATVDTPLTGVAVTLIDDTSTVYVAITDGAGRFSRVVSAGNTIVDVDDATLPAAQVLTTGNDGSDPDTVFVPDGGSARDDTGYVTASGPVGALSGRVWLDADTDGAQGAGESGVLGIAVQLREAVGGAVVATAYTDPLGNYSFPSIAPGDYLIDPVVPADYYVTTDNDPYPATVSNDSHGGTDFGINSGRSQSGVVYNSATRAPVAGAQVSLSGPAGFDAGDVAGGSTTQTTGADGTYRFLLLPSAPAGTYTLAVTAGGLSFPSTAIPPSTAPGSYPGGDVSGISGAPAIGQDTTYYLSFPRPTVALVNNNIPLDPLPTASAASVRPIPTLSEWATLLLASLMIAGAGWQQLRRRGR